MGRLASDIGETFTDLVYFDDARGTLQTSKSLTTPGDLTQGVVDTIGIMGYYQLLAMVMNTARTPLRDGMEPMPTFPR